MLVEEPLVMERGKGKQDGGFNWLHIIPGCQTLHVPQLSYQCAVSGQLALWSLWVVVLSDTDIQNTISLGRICVYVFYSKV